MLMYFLMIVLVLLLISYLILGVFLFFSFFAMASGAPFVPSSKEHVREMLEFAEIKPGELVVDLGSGDGRLLIESAKLNASAIGWEINPLLCSWSRFMVKKAKLEDKIKIFRGNLWNADISRADVVTLYLITHKMKRMKDKLLKELKPGARIVSNGFRFPDWPAVKDNGSVYLYIKN